MANVRVACEVAGVSRATAYRTRADNQTFARQWDEAIEAACDRLEQEAWRRGVAGVERPVTVAGEKEMVREYSDRMLEMLLKAHRPEKFRERYDVTTRVAGSDLDREIRELVDELNRRAMEAGGEGWVRADRVASSSIKTNNIEGLTDSRAIEDAIERTTVPVSEHRDAFVEE
jgi:hypothetical protein